MNYEKKKIINKVEIPTALLDYMQSIDDAEIELDGSMTVEDMIKIITSRMTDNIESIQNDFESGVQPYTKSKIENLAKIAHWITNINEFIDDAPEDEKDFEMPNFDAIKMESIFLEDFVYVYEEENTTPDYIDYREELKNVTN